MSLILLSLIIYATLPVQTYDLSNPPSQPTTSYDQSIQQINASLQAEQSLPINPVCKSRIYTHRQPTHRAVLLIHGLTNCPQQFDAFAQQLYAQGFNVYVPLMPHHGFADRLTTELSQLRAQELITFTDEQLNLTKGLGEKTEIMGLSVGGIMTAWAGQTRSDVEHAIVLAPNLAYQEHTAWSNAIARTALWLPNQFWWWDKTKQLDIPGPQYAYPRYATRAVGESFKLGSYVRHLAQQSPIHAQRLTMVTNDHDEAVNKIINQQLLDLWENKASDKVHHYTIPATIGVGHDLIDPLQPYAHTTEVYPLLNSLLLAD